MVFADIEPREETLVTSVLPEQGQTKGKYIMEQELRRKQSFLLRLPFSVREQATLLAREEGTSLNHFISLAVAEKISRMHPPAALKQTPSRMEELVPATPFNNFRFGRIA